MTNNNQMEFDLTVGMNNNTQEVMDMEFKTTFTLKATYGETEITKASETLTVENVDMAEAEMKQFLGDHLRSFIKRQKLNVDNYAVLYVTVADEEEAVAWTYKGLNEAGKHSFIFAKAKDIKANSFVNAVAKDFSLKQIKKEETIVKEEVKTEVKEEVVATQEEVNNVDTAMAEFSELMEYMKDKVQSDAHVFHGLRMYPKGNETKQLLVDTIMKECNNDRKVMGDFVRKQLNSKFGVTDALKQAAYVTGDTTRILGDGTEWVLTKTGKMLNKFAHLVADVIEKPAKRPDYLKDVNMVKEYFTKK